ncbi:MAG: glycoside hydrolase family 25 protein [Solirubrobacterales bacterium]
MGLAGHRSRLGAALVATSALLALAMLVAGSTAQAAPKHIRGIDVSRFQGHIAWKQVGQTQTKFAFLQASRGSGDDCLVVPDQCGADPTYLRNYKKARAEGIRVGAYHRAFASDPGTEIDGVAGAKLDARQEANLFASVVGQLRGRDLRPVLDVETPFTDLDELELRAWIKAWLSRVERKLGSKPIIYTNNSSWQATGDTTAFALDGHPSGSPTSASPPWSRPPTGPARDGRFGSTRASGTCAGSSGNVDKNKLARGFGKIKAH